MVAKEENGKMVAQKQLIKMGLSNKNITEVIDGLKVGDLLIVNGFQELAEGQILEIKGATNNG
jgi:hypothetical protein